MRNFTENSTINRLPVSKEPKTQNTDDILTHLAFDNSLLPNIISLAASGRVIMANSAVLKLLGYSKKELLTKNRAEIFDINNRSFKTMLKQRGKEGHSKALVTAIKKDGKPIPCEITSVVFVGVHGIRKAITTIVDMRSAILEKKNMETEQKKLIADEIVLAKAHQKKIDILNEKTVNQKIIVENTAYKAKLIENEAWKRNIGKTLYDVMWDWDLVSNEIYSGDSIREVFGYNLKNNTINITDFLEWLLPEEKGRVSKKIMKTLGSKSKCWNDSFLLKRQNGSVASTTSRASIIRDGTGRAIRLIGAIRDISRLDELEKKLDKQMNIRRENSEVSILAAKLSFDGIWDWNLVTNEFFLGEGVEKLFGQEFKNNKDIAYDWLSQLHPLEKDSIKDDLKEIIASMATYWEHAYRFAKIDGSVMEVFTRANIIRDNKGKALRIIGVMHDFSKQKMLEERLQQEISLKEIQIAEASEDAKEMERSVIGQELHDNVNQLLGASRLYLDMAKRGGGDVTGYLSRSSEYILTAIEEIRKLTKGLATDIIKNIGLTGAIGNTIKDIMETTPLKLSFLKGSFEENKLTDKFKLNLFRIVQEQLNNIIKHSKATQATISLFQSKNSTTLVISDNGRGFDTSQTQGGTGMANIRSRAVSYKGVADFVSGHDHGCVLTVNFPAQTFHKK
jgi:PAS domain S-box-containing protein